MTQIVLYSAPGSCSRVATIALEEAGVSFESRVVRFMKGEHKSPDYKKHNPKGKVPALIVDGEALTENVAILSYIAEIFPEARLLPPVQSALEKARQIADLSFCSSTLHPIVTRIRMPQFFAGQEGAEAVYAAGREAMREYFLLIEDRLAAGPWWYGEDWSVMDAYLYWVFWRVEGAGFSTKDYPRYGEHARRMEGRPAVQRALEREAAMIAALESEGLNFRPPPPPNTQR